MICAVCKDQVRDLNDIQRRIEELVIGQKRAVTAAERLHHEHEIRALTSAKAEFESRHLKHKQSVPH